ncbi:MAG: MarR family transcriptional regulator [Devosia sp.]|uniref:MarR family winged helix-turn-helix transcriptional regulator n=1 Tax=unclassified Devosia TaxID=196773 RepID=UPI0019E792FA|nr:MULTISPECIES: MarR family transcriptional regulator [unclassified Devosia]MBF0679081.1 MarR family transcriptional regulator [Devosia sp.]WEJ33696.1 MarR family transcriptional regulator [Devosia sp. SD17-2]
MANPSQTDAHEQRLNVRADALYRVHEVSRLISSHFDQLVAEHGITRAQWTAIMHISQNSGASQSQMAEIMQMGRAAAGKMFDRLEEKGWIERRDDPDDSRLRRVYARNEIAPLQDVIPDAAAKLYDVFYAGLSDQQVNELHHTLTTMIDNARSSVRQGAVDGS